MANVSFGVNFFPTVGPGEKSGSQFYEECLTICERADDLGFRSIKTVEHYFFDYGGYSPDPVTFLAAAAARTKRIRLVTGAVLPTFNHPIKLAAKLAMLDNLSHGRLDAGFGRAFLPDEFAAYQVSMDESRPRFEEGVAAVKELWTNPRATWNGTFHQFGPVRLLPEPFQKPHPPIYVAAALSPDSCAWAGRQGYHVMLVPYILNVEHGQSLINAWRKGWDEGGNPPGAGQLQLSYHAYVAEDGAEARRKARQYYDDYNRKFAAAVEAWGSRTATQYPGYENLARAQQNKSFDADYEQGKVLAGDPDEVLKLVQQAADWWGDFEASVQLNFSTMPLEEALRTIDLLARHVMSKVAGSTGRKDGLLEARGITHPISS